MSLRVAVTRALPDAERTAERIRARGAEAVLAPLLRIALLDFEASLADTQALVFTSANGVRAFAAASNARDTAAFCVGEATGAAARSAGFAEVHVGGGDGAALAALLRGSLDARAGKLVHVSGAHLAYDIGAELAAAGLNLERRIAYEARAADTAPAGLAAPLDVVLFHSARAAEAFLALGAPGAARLKAACISPAVAAAAAPAGWAGLAVATAPTDDALVTAGLSSTDAIA